jgi:hypothetical protein
MTTDINYWKDWFGNVDPNWWHSWFDVTSVATTSPSSLFIGDAVAGVQKSPGLASVAEQYGLASIV